MAYPFELPFEASFEAPFKAPLKLPFPPLSPLTQWHGAPTCTGHWVPKEGIGPGSRDPRCGIFGLGVLCLRILSSGIAHGFRV